MSVTFAAPRVRNWPRTTTLLAIAALVFVRRWWGKPWDARALWLGGVMAAMAVLWAMSFDGWAFTPRSDQFYKYLLAIASLGFLQVAVPKVRPIGWGMLAGALGAAGTGAGAPGT